MDHHHLLSPLPPYIPQLTIKKKPAVLTNESTPAFKNASDGKHVELAVRGTWYDRSASVTFGGDEQPVAHITRSFFNLREIFADKDTVSFIFLYLLRFWMMVMIRGGGE